MIIILRILFNRSCIFFSTYILGIAATVKSKGSSGINEYVSSLFDQSLTWKDVEWLKSISKLPIVIKGVLTVNTALQAYEHGAAAIIVSNHGARQLDGVPATIDMLPNIGTLFFSVIYIYIYKKMLKIILNRFRICYFLIKIDMVITVDALKAKDPNFEVYVDGGIRKGTDILKAIALGAKMVFVGRPALWGLAYNGKEGVTKTLDILRKEFDSVMSLSGNTDVKSINREIMLIPKSLY